LRFSRKSRNAIRYAKFFNRSYDASKAGWSWDYVLAMIVFGARYRQKKRRFNSSQNRRSSAKSPPPTDGDDLIDCLANLQGLHDDGKSSDK
jgi:hypothetical protein